MRNAYCGPTSCPIMSMLGRVTTFELGLQLKIGLITQLTDFCFREGVFLHFDIGSIPFRWRIGLFAFYDLDRYF